MSEQGLKKWEISGESQEAMYELVETLQEKHIPVDGAVLGYEQYWLAQYPGGVNIIALAEILRQLEIGHISPVRALEVVMRGEYDIQPSEFPTVVYVIGNIRTVR